MILSASFENLHEHDHGDCVARVLADMERASLAEGLNVTPIRRRVLEILLESHAALGAYEILKRLSADGRAGQPPIVYRALDFLQKHGFVHKIEGLNAFVACMHPSEDHAPVFLICRSCHVVAETTGTGLRSHLNDAAHNVGFAPDHIVIEAQGLCSQCQKAEA